MKFVAAFVAGAATVLAYAPFGFFPLGIAGPAVLFYLWLSESPRRAFFLGLYYGVGLFGTGVSWVYVSMHVYGHMPAALASLAVLIFVFILSLYIAVVGLLQAWFSGSLIVRAVLVTPAIWTLAEWLRGWLWTGFPWLSLGYGQINGALSGLAQWLGTYGVSWTAATIAGLLVAIVAKSSIQHRIVLIGVIFALWISGWAAGQWSWVHPNGEPRHIAAVQGNVPLVNKWEPAQRDAILRQYLQMSAAQTDRDLIVWPEAALPLYLDQLPDEFWVTLREHPADFAFGVLERFTEGDTVKSFNSVVTVSDQRSVYRKQHLVPFGEFLPLPFLLGWIIDYLRIPMSDFSAWPSVQKTVPMAGTQVGISICYEDAFLEEVRQSLPSAGLLINVSEDSWFGDSLAPHQRLDMARMRALESGRPMIRAANTGVSAVIDHTGQIVARTEQFVRTVLRAEVQPMQGVTPFVRFGSRPVVMVCMVIVFIGFARSFKATEEKTRPG